VAVARGLAESCAGTGITVNSVLAGPTASEGVSAFVEKLARERNLSVEEFEREFFKTMRPTSLLKRFLEPDEVARVVVFLCSPEAIAVNGAAVRAEGGVVKAAL
jgi:NAD(P)-dependent dehydrogenase (short-subunit alcohol dehydrogenase family)